MVVEDEGGGIPIDSLGSRSSSRASGRSGVSGDESFVRKMTSGMRDFTRTLTDAERASSRLLTTLNKVAERGGRIGNVASTMAGRASSTMSARTSMPVAGTGAVAPLVGGGGGGGAGGGGGGGLMGGGGGAPGSLGSTVSNAKALTSQLFQPARDLNNYMNQRIGQGAEYSLQADRMSVQLQQMYGMSNSQVRNQLRMPLTQHYMLGGGAAINTMLGMQARTGLSAAQQASTVEAFRTMSGFSLGTSDATRMIETMATPDVANRMFMMGGTGIYGIGGQQRSGLQSIQDIVRKTGLTNPEALKGALQAGSNTRQRLTAMGVPQDMQDMVIQYAMQNTEFQRKTGTSAMYDPSMEQDRATMGIEGSYAVQHEKTTGERVKREERFYGRQVDNFADFERNLRSTTKVLAAFEDVLSGLVGLKISTAGHPVGKAMGYMAGQASALMGATANLGLDVAALTATGGMSAVIPGGDPLDPPGKSYKPTLGGDASVDGSQVKLSSNNEQKLAQLDPKLAVPLRKMLQDNPKLRIGDAKRSSEQQERSFKQRYRPRPDLSKKTKEEDRIWNGVVWEHIAGKNVPAMAPPGGSWHEKGLAADVHGDDSWIVANASKYGLGHGGTGRGGPGDEPFHIQPSSLMGQTPDNRGQKIATTTKSESGSSSKSSVGKAGARASYTPAKPTMSAPGSTSQWSPSTTDFTQLTAAKQMKAVSSVIPGTDKPRGGDPIDSMRGTTSTMSTGGAYNVTIAPNIYLNGTADVTSDMRRLAREIGHLLDQEVRLKLMRGQ